MNSIRHYILILFKVAYKIVCFFVFNKKLNKASSNFIISPAILGQTIKFQRLIFVFAFSAILLLNFFASAQKYYEKKQIIPSSPNISALEKFINYPVNLYTGVPSIGLPLHSIRLKGLDIPLNLSYHASGIKVDEISSNVGVGWSLQAGGVVSIQVNGILDELSGYGPQHSKYSKIKNFTLQASYPDQMVDCNTLAIVEDIFDLYSGGDVDFLRNVTRANDDTEPDIYSYSFNGKSGKFFLDETGVFRTIPYSKVKIERLFNGSIILGYQITDEDGAVYRFDKLEETSVNSFNICNSGPQLYSPYQGQGRSYHLSKITTPLNDVVNFFYSSSGYSYQLQSSFSRGAYITTGACNDFNVSGNNAYNCTTNSIMNVGTWRLDSIISTEGTRVKIEYGTSDRLDLPSTKALTGLKVESILSGNQIKYFSLNQDYWNGRLRLRSVTEFGKPPYLFDYNNLSGGAARLSFSQDHWGYYNGASNTTLLPLDDYNGFPDGANREPVPSAIEAGILTKVTYPTGGNAEYFYEPNEYFVSTPSVVINKTLGASLISVPNKTVSYSFSVPSTSSQPFVSFENTFDGTNFHNDYCYIDILGPNGYFQRFVGNSVRKYITLPFGNYTLRIENVGNSYSASASIFWFDHVSVPPHNKIGGGLRIREIKASDANSSSSIIRKFEYKLPGSSNSSGKNMYTPIYAESRTENRMIPSSGCSYPGAFTCALTTQSSSSITPLVYSGGYHVGYTNVVEYNFSKTGNGYSEHKFIIENDNSLSGGVPSVPYPTIVNYDWINGSLLEQKDYAYNGVGFDLKRKVKRTYNYDKFDNQSNLVNTYTIYGSKVMMTIGPRVTGICNTCPGAIADLLGGIQFGIQRHQLFSSWHYLTKEEVEYYDGGTVHKTESQFLYDNPSHLRPTRIISKNSKDELNITYIKFPLDFQGVNHSTTIGLGIKNLIDKNIISAEVEKTATISKSSGLNERTLSSSINIYDPILPLPLLIKGFESTSPVNNLQRPSISNGQFIFDSRYKDQGRFKYNTSGNIIELQKKNDVVESYVWGYGNQYPVAMILGESYDKSISQSGIDISILNHPANDVLLRTQLNKLRIGLPNAQVTTYTYAPLFGITSQTDPNGLTTFYDYDGFGRLKRIKDHQGNTLKQFDYQYQKPITQ